MRTPSFEDFLRPWIQRFADILVGQLAERFAPLIAGDKRNGKTILGMNGDIAPIGKRPYKLDMRCHWPRCLHISGGPRNRYMCETHMKEPITKIRAALVEYKRIKLHREIAAAARASGA